jgi:hypothetical protein
MAVDTPGPDAAGPDAVMMDLDVGQPWQHATAAGGPGAQAAPSGSNGSSAVTRPVLDPQLLSMRPLALDHLLVTQVRVMEAGAGARAGGGGGASVCHAVGWRQNTGSLLLAPGNSVCWLLAPVQGVCWTYCVPYHCCCCCCSWATWLPACVTQVTQCSWHPLLMQQLHAR